MAKMMRLEVSVSVATAYTPMNATVNHPKAVVAGNCYHLANTNNIPANRMASRNVGVYTARSSISFDGDFEEFDSWDFFP
jgi:hypothetical protein